MKEHLQAIFDSVLNGDDSEIAAMVQEALGAGIPADRILSEGMIPSMDEVGRRFESGEYFVPEMLVSAQTMQAGLEVLRPLLAESGVEPIARVAIGSVKGDLHDIGKNLVGMMLEGAGFEVLDLGVDVESGRFVEAGKSGAQLLGLSALVTTTMAEMQTVIEACRRAGLRDKVKIMIGGAPVTQEFADKIGADGYAPDAAGAVTLAKSLLDAG